jgi:hypothetical protein
VEEEEEEEKVEEEEEELVEAKDEWVYDFHKSHLILTTYL